MKRTIEKIYFACVCMCLLAVLCIAVFYHLDVIQDTENSTYTFLTDYERTITEDSKAPAGIRVDYVFPAEDVQQEHCSLVFYTNHQGVSVEVGEKEVYSLATGKDNFFGKTVGSVWNTIPLTEENNGQVIHVTLYPAYEDTADRIPDFYFGGRFYIFRDIILKSVPSILLSGAAIIVGLVFVFFVLYNHKNSEVDQSLMMLGCFSSMIGLWKLSDMSVTNLIFPNRPVIAFLPFFALLLTTIPFIMFIKELFTTAESIVWYIPCIASAINIVLVVVLQFLDIADMRQMLWMNHGIFLLMVVVVVSMTVREVCTVGLNRKLKRNICCMSACFIGLIVDLSVYYFGSGNDYMIVGMIGFMCYIVVLGLDSMQEAKQLMAIGMRAKRFEQMAFHDQLTGLYNRTAYADFIKNADFAPERCIVVMCDLNELKKCNDTQGHECGDVYIKESAKIINEAFGDIGQCYRMGGDEFCVLIIGSSLEECRQRKAKLQELVVQFNETHTNIHMGIACGYELYDKRVDYDINDTSRRADKMMYLEKFSMKHVNEGAYAQRTARE